MSALCLHSAFGAATTTTLHRHSLLHTRPSMRRFVALSAHSNAKLLKSSRKSKYARPLSLYDDDSDDEEDEEDEEEEEEKEKEDDWLADDDDDFAQVQEYDINGRKYRSQKKAKKVKGRPEKVCSIVSTKDQERDNFHAGSPRFPVKDHGVASFKSGRSLQVAEEELPIRNVHSSLEKSFAGNPSLSSSNSQGVDNRQKMMIGNSMENRYKQLSEEIELDEKWLPLLDCLNTFGLKESHFIQM